jgi:3-dehydroquinate dehydratase
MDNLTINFYIYNSLLLQLKAFEGFVPVFNKRPKLQQARARMATELRRYTNQLNADFTNKELELMNEVASALGMAIEASILNPAATNAALDQLLQTIKQTQSNEPTNLPRT